MHMNNLMTSEFAEVFIKEEIGTSIIEYAILVLIVAMIGGLAFLAVQKAIV